MKWSIDQKKIIEDRGKSILVSAAAGSGKTAVMVERIIDMISDEKSDVSLDNVVIMTFTDAAAGGMKTKIAESLKKRIEAEPENKKLKLQKALLNRANISTIHSFCQRLIKQNYQTLDIDPGFRLCDDAEARMLKADVLTELLEEKYAENADEVRDENLNELILSLQKKKDVDGRLTAAIENIYSFVMAQPFADEVFNKWSAECEAELCGSYEKSEWYRWLIDSIHEDIREHKELLELAVSICRESEFDRYEPMLLEYADICDKLLGLNSYSDIKNALEAVSYSQMASLRNVSDKDRQVLIKDVIVKNFKDYLTNAASSLLKKYFVLTGEELEFTVKGQARLLSALLKLTREFTERFDSIKREKNILDFNDLEHMALKLLYVRDEASPDSQPVFSPLADELSGSITQIMIDEYQDSSNVQEALLNALSGERFDKPNVFMVGDVKQSIYRFRNARPQLFNEKYNSFTDSENTTQRKIELDTNFRSRREVLDSVNAVFDRIMTSGFGGIEYAGKARLSCGNTSNPADSDKKTEIIYLDAAGTKADDNSEQAASGGSEDDEELKATELEARIIAERIKELVGKSDPEKAMKILKADSDGEALKPASYRDITVLVRRKAVAAVIKDVLNKNDIPAFFDTKSGYYDAQEINMMISLLNIIDNPLQDIPLVTVLKGVIGGFNNDELAVIRADFLTAQAEGYHTQPGDYYRALSLYAENGTDSELKAKASSFMAMLNSYRDMADAVPVHVLLNSIYIETGYYDYACALDLGEQRRKNLDMLMKKAEDYGRTDYQGLFNFVRYVEILKKNETDFGEASVLSENDDVVNITTIHSSKGLEYPIVFLAGAASAYGGKPSASSIELSELGIGMDYLDLKNNISYPSLKRLAIKKLNSEEEMAEEERLLYVAMTRAKEKLIITGASRYYKADREKPVIIGEGLEECLISPADEIRKFPIGIIRSFKKYIGWLLSAASADKSSFDIKTMSMEELNEKAYKKEEAERLEYADILAGIKEKALTEEEPASGDTPKKYEEDSKEGDAAGPGELEKRVKRIFSQKYPYEEETRLKPKISVSEIKKLSEAEAKEAEEAEDTGIYETDALGNVYVRRNIDRPSASKYGQGQNNAALRGTAFHRAMELLGYSGSVEKDIEALYGSLQFAETEKKLLDKGAVEDFLKSDIARRMGEAHKKNRLYREQHFMAGFPANTLIEGQKSGELQLLQGIIDAYFEEDGRLVLVDYKTDRVQRAEELKERYGVQLKLYKRALEQLTGMQVKECVIYSTCLKTEIYMD